MLLKQKKFPFTCSRFELTETSLLVVASRMVNSRSREIPLRELGSIPTYLKQFALAPLMFAISLTLLALVFADMGFDLTFTFIEDERAGLWALAAVTSFFAACVWLRFFDRTGSYAIFHGKMSGRPVVFINRSLPSPRYAEEFIEILRERIDQTHR